MKLTIYHNTRCRKSREALKYLEENNHSFEIIEYLKEPLSTDKIKDLLNLLDYSAEELVRKNEGVWKDDFKGKSLTQEQVIQALSDHPKLIERPIISDGKKAVVARPLEQIKKILK